MLGLRGALCGDIGVSRMTRRRLGLGLLNALLNLGTRNCNQPLQGGYERP